MVRATKRTIAYAGREGTDAICIATVYNRSFRLVMDKSATNGLPMISISLPKGSSGFSVSNLTADELLAVRNLFMVAFDLAEPICVELDNQAKEAWENGDDTFQRLYRVAPVFAFRERLVEKHYSGVPNGSSILAGVVARVRRSTAHLAGIGDRLREVSKRAADELVSDDDAAAPGHHQELGEGPGDADVPS